MKLRTLVTITFAITIAFGMQARGAEEDDSLGAKFKRIFAKHTPTPTPTPRKKAHKKPSPSPTPEASAAEGSPSSAETSPASSVPEKSPDAETAESTPSETPARPRNSHATVFEPVRPITPAPGRRSSKAVPSERESPTADENPPETPAQKTAASVASKKSGPSGAIISAAEIADYDNYPVEIHKVVDAGIDLAGKNLGYKYNSADPAKGGMDSSGFIYYVLSNAGIKDVPRDARDQYVWVRKAGNFQAVLSQRDDTFELDALKPGDLLFWANTSGPNRDPEVTQTMIYLGREKGTNQRLMVGATDGRSYKGQQRAGVSVFEFKVGRAKNAKSEEPGPSFVGYARIPGLPAD